MTTHQTSGAACALNVSVKDPRIRNETKQHILYSRPAGATGTSIEMGYFFAEMHGRGCILVPGKFIVKEFLEELGTLSEYMTRYQRWIEKTFAPKLVYLTVNGFLSILIIFPGIVSN